ncbi:uncharacterized protein LOC127252423 isoform X2 [Andrographis paniculata]|uniref:uncharacterized protein LOC127252423 isoform X2 n=1 Tax=Andrographis paniculata TaxID=175694 RepID=UPI0021E73D3B|nr:uncharacterized protein LOC127252423 isoform X2 [Andrographis paniculata]
MWTSTNCVGLRILRSVSAPPGIVDTCSLWNSRSRRSRVMDSSRNRSAGSSQPAPQAHTYRSLGSRENEIDAKDNKQRSRGRGGGRSGSMKNGILRHMASELKLDMRRDGYVKVQDLLQINMKTYANFPLRSHTIDDVIEAVGKDNKQRFSLLEENGELWIRANQGHTIKTVETESLLKPILSPEEVPVCVHGTYKKNLESILQEGLKRMKRLHVHFSHGLPTDGKVISGMRRDVNVLVYLDVKKALEDGMKLYISDNRVILTEGFNGVVPVKYFNRIESWPQRQPIAF